MGTTDQDNWDTSARVPSEIPTSKVEERLKVCVRCRAIVIDWDMADHIQWHENLKTALRKLNAQRAGMANRLVEKDVMA